MVGLLGLLRGVRVEGGVGRERVVWVERGW